MPEPIRPIDKADYERHLQELVHGSVPIVALKELDRQRGVTASRPGPPLNDAELLETAGRLTGRELEIGPSTPPIPPH